jgi:hypothetical protein
MNLPTNNNCPREEIAAYLDGELDGAALTVFEDHAEQCGDCAKELRSQRQLLCTLEAAFGKSGRIDLPENFTRVVAAHAENDMQGLRHKTEYRRAMKLCAVLLLAAFTLLGASSNNLIFQPIRAFLRVGSSALDMLLQSIADAVEGVAIIARMIAHTTITSPRGFGILTGVVFLIAISLLPRLIANYHRTEFIE